MVPPVSSDIEGTDVMTYFAGKKTTITYYRLQQNTLFAIYILESNNLEVMVRQIGKQGRARTISSLCQEFICESPQSRAEGLHLGF